MASWKWRCMLVGTVLYYLAPALVMGGIGFLVAVVQMLILRRRRVHGDPVVPPGLEGHHCGACLFAKECRVLEEEGEGRDCPADRQGSPAPEEDDERRPPPQLPSGRLV